MFTNLANYGAPPCMADGWRFATPNTVEGEILHHRPWMVETLEIMG